MSENKLSGIRVGEEIWISYKEDNEQVVNGYVILISISDSLITFQTKTNKITLPISRVLKIKQKNG